MPGCARGTESVGRSKEAMGDVRRFINSKDRSVVSSRDDVKMIIRTRILDND